jgi:hypothetical protein
MAKPRVSQFAITPGVRITDGAAMYIVTHVTVTVNEDTGLPATLQVDALSVIEVERREAEYATMLR